MHVKIISTGWQCAPYIERSLRSVAEQTHTDWEIMLVIDPSTDGTDDIVWSWCSERQEAGDERWRYQINPERRYAVRNQVEGLRLLDPGPDDIIVWLDPDGDRFAHPDALAHIVDAYADGVTLLTYGSFRPDPPGPYEQPTPFPEDVATARGWRHEIRWVHHHFNHPRTMKGRVFHAIPDDHYRWRNGRWYDHGCDYIFMTAGLELADGRYKCLDEVLTIYNAGNPHADNREHPRESSACTVDYLARPPLPPLDVRFDLPPSMRLPSPAAVRGVAAGLSMPYTPVRTPNGDPFLTSQQRIEVLRGLARTWKPRYFVETGTLTGDTPAALRREFARLYTIELSRDFYERAVLRFAGTNVTCLHGDSGELLAKVLAELDGPALLWLDGHYCGGDSARGDVDTPAAAELDAALASPHRNIIVFDDARLYGGMTHHTAEFADYPHVETIADKARAAGYDIEIRDDMIRLTPA